MESKCKILLKKDEIFKLENSFNLDQSKIYSGEESNIPLTLMFDYSENIHPYRMKNIKITEDVNITEMSNNCKVDNFIPLNPPQSNNFLKLLNDDFLNENEKKDIKNDMEIYHPSSVSKNEVYNLEDDKLYDFMDFEHNIKNWNDFCQVKVFFL